MLNIMASYSKHLVRTNTGLASQLRISVGRLARRLRQERDPGHQLSTTSISVLYVLSRRGEMTIGQLAEAEGVQPPSMTRVVNYLEDRGYLERRASKEDGRIVLVAIREPGRELLAEEERRRDAWLTRRVEALTGAERDILRQATPLLERLASQEEPQ